MYPLSFYTDALAQNGLKVNIHQKNVIGFVEKIPQLMQSFHIPYAD